MTYSSTSRVNSPREPAVVKLCGGYTILRQIAFQPFLPSVGYSTIGGLNVIMRTWGLAGLLPMHPSVKECDNQFVKWAVKTLLNSAVKSFCVYGLETNLTSS